MVASGPSAVREPKAPTAPRTEFPFTLPHGYLSPDGVLHREGMMRMSTAFDEIAPLKDPRVQGNPGYLVLILLSRVVTKLGSLEHINPKTIEGLMTIDLTYLQGLYRRINESGHARLRVSCPHCEGRFEVETTPVGEA